MPGKLEIQNGSILKDINIALLSVDGIETLLNQKVIKKNENIKLNVSGGVKNLIVYSDTNNIIWKGMIPSYISHPIIIYPDYKRVIYKDTIIVNTLSKKDKSKIFLYILLPIIIIICYCIYLI